jgi:hypothetical protein
MKMPAEAGSEQKAIADTADKSLLFHKLLVSKSATKNGLEWRRYELEVIFPEGCTQEILEQHRLRLENIIDAWLFRMIDTKTRGVQFDT